MIGVRKCIFVCCVGLLSRCRKLVKKFLLGLNVIMVCVLFLSLYISVIGCIGMLVLIVVWKMWVWNGFILWLSWVCFFGNMFIVLFLCRWLVIICIMLLSDLVLLCWWKMVWLCVVS